WIGVSGSDRGDPHASARRGHGRRAGRVVAVRVVAVRCLLRGVSRAHRHPRGTDAPAGAGGAGEVETEPRGVGHGGCRVAVPRATTLGGGSADRCAGTVFHRRRRQDQAVAVAWFEVDGQSGRPGGPEGIVPRVVEAPSWLVRKRRSWRGSARCHGPNRRRCRGTTSRPAPWSTPWGCSSNAWATTRPPYTGWTPRDFPRGFGHA